MSENDELKRSAENLKKAVPLMLKYQVPTTPPNYALWYTYVDKTEPELNRIIDEAVKQFGHCPPSTNQQLHSQFIAQKSEANFSELKSSVEKLLQELSSSMVDTISDTNNFSALIEKNFANLKRIENEKLSFEEIMNLVKTMLMASQTINHSTKFLESQLNRASQEIDQLKCQLAEVKQQSVMDSLTGLHNRQAFDIDIESIQNSSQEICLIIADVDHFKSFNDQFGHLFGDAVLKAIGHKMSAMCREQMIAYRIGGEEFALIIPNKSFPIARQFADSVRRSIEKINLKDRKSGQMISSITASFGVAQRQGNEPISKLIERTDKLMYEAKKLGRNRVMPLH
jgi:diguanylate cyclase